MDIEKIKKQREELVEKGVDHLKVRTIGQHVVDLIQHGDKLSIQSLKAALEKSRDAARKEPDRMLAEAALACLQESQDRPE